MSDEKDKIPMPQKPVEIISPIKQVATMPSDGQPVVRSATLLPSKGESFYAEVIIKDGPTSAKAVPSQPTKGDSVPQEEEKL